MTASLYKLHRIQHVSLLTVFVGMIRFRLSFIAVIACRIIIIATGFSILIENFYIQSKYLCAFRLNSLTLIFSFVFAWTHFQHHTINSLILLLIPLSQYIPIDWEIKNASFWENLISWKWKKKYVHVVAIWTRAHVLKTSHNSY